MEEETIQPQQLFVHQRHASRLELFIRIIYGFFIGLVLMVYGFAASICQSLLWLNILILGSRNEGLSLFIKGYLEYQVHVLSYTSLLTDRRPGIIPRKSEIFEEELE